MGGSPVAAMLSLPTVGHEVGTGILERGRISPGPYDLVPLVPLQQRIV